MGEFGPLPFLVAILTGGIVGLSVSIYLLSFGAPTWMAYVAPMIGAFIAPWIISRHWN